MSLPELPVRGCAWVSVGQGGAEGSPQGEQVNERWTGPR